MFPLALSTVYLATGELSSSYLARALLTQYHRVFVDPGGHTAIPLFMAITRRANGIRLGPADPEVLTFIPVSVLHTRAPGPQHVLCQTSPFPWPALRCSFGRDIVRNDVFETLCSKG